MAKAKTLRDKDGGIVYPVTKASITYLNDNTTTVQAALAGKEPAIEEGEESEYFRGDKTWQTLNKTAVGLANVDNTSDASKKSSFTAAGISDSETGFATGAQVYGALEYKEDVIEEGTTSQYFRGDKSWQTLDKSAVGLSNVDNTSDATKKANFAAAGISASETGFTTGAQVNTALSGKESTIAAGTTAQYFRGDKSWQTLDKAAVGLGNVDNTSDATKKTSFTGEIEEDNTGFATGGDVYALVNPIDTAIDQSFMNGLALKAGTSTTVVELTKSLKNIKTGATSTADFALPVASASQAGIVNATTYATIQDSADKIDSILGGSVAIENLPASPTQAQLTAAWKQETGREELFNQAGIFDTTNAKIWTYFENDETWHFVNAGEAKVTQWGTGVAGIITGASDDSGNEGKIFAETDGTGSVIGWDALTTAVSNNTNNIESLEDSKEDVITAGTASQYYRGDKTWQTLNKAAVGLENVDNTSDATKKTNFTAASISSSETGFTTGAQVNAALASYASYFDVNPAIEDIVA